MEHDVSYMLAGFAGFALGLAIVALRRVWIVGRRLRELERRELERLGKDV